MKKEIIRGLIVPTHLELKNLEKIRDSKLAVSVMRAFKSLLSIQEETVEVLKKLNTENQDIETFAATDEKAIEFLNEKVEVEFKPLPKMPNVELTGQEMLIIDTYFIEDDEGNALPEGPDPTGKG